MENGILFYGVFVSIGPPPPPPNGPLFVASPSDVPCSQYVYNI